MTKTIMKFWELISIFAFEKATLSLVLDRPNWKQYGEWYQMYATHVGAQDRSILDAVVPDELCREALALSRQKYVIRDGQLTTYTDDDAKLHRELLTPVQAFNRFGGSALEEVSEKGSYIIVNGTAG